MIKKLALFFISLCSSILIIEVGLRLIGRYPAYFETEKELPIIKPTSFFKKDDILGWRSSTGKFHFFHYNGSLIFECTIDSNGNRIIPITWPLEKSTLNNHTKKNLALYGCSYTFGQSVSDTSNYPYYLQKLIPYSTIRNRGVSGYGLVQMFLALKSDVENNIKPDVAIFNYADFLDERTVLEKQWLNRFHWSISQRTKSLEINYPYAKLVNRDSLIVEYLEWKDWSTDWPFRDKSALINLANSTFNNVLSLLNKQNNQKTILRCFDAIIKYCNENKIKLVIYGFYSNNNVFKNLINKNVTTKISSVDIRLPDYNCSPLDAQHPNKKAHKIYAQEVFDCLLQKNLINKTDYSNPN